MTSGDGRLNIGLPGSDGSTTRISANGEPYFLNRDNTSIVPVKKEDGTVQIISVSASKRSAASLRYQLDLPAGTSIQPLPDGGFVMVNGEGHLVGMIDAPWALDARGGKVQTRYEIQGNTLVQVLGLNAPGIAFPVVADPSVSWFWWGYAVKYTKSETKTIADQSLTASAAALLCGYISVYQARVICATLAFIVINLYWSVFKSAAAHHKCAQVNYPFAPPPVPILVFEVKC